MFEVVDAEEQITRLNDTHAIKETIKSLQQFAMLRHYFKRFVHWRYVSSYAQEEMYLGYYTSIYVLWYSETLLI